MIADGNAYADGTDPTVQKEERCRRLPSKRRDRPPAESLAIFNEMRTGPTSAGNTASAPDRVRLA
jgi:glutamyl-tRNA synthetase